MRNATAANVLILASAVGYPLGNFFPSTLSGVGFTNAASLDFHLSASSLYKGKATDGRDPGANVDGVNAASAGVVVP